MKEREKNINHNWAEIKAKGILAFAFITLLTSCGGQTESLTSDSEDLINKINSACKNEQIEVCQKEIIPRYTDLYKYHCIAWIWDSERSQLTTDKTTIFPNIQGCPKGSSEIRARDIGGVCQFLLDNGSVLGEDDFNDTNFDSLCVLK